MPPNDDNFANATRVSGPINTAFTIDNTGATLEAGEDVTYANDGGFGLPTGDHTLWYSYTATADGSVTFQSASPGNTDTHLQVFEGDYSAASQVVEGSFDPTDNGNGTTLLASTATFDAVQGHTYYIQLGTYPDAVDSGFNQGDVSLTQTAGPEGEADPACYLRGTLILTGTGERAVEDLAIGERVVTASGALKPVRWIGRRSYAARFAGRKVAPVRIAVGALGDNFPRRDLWVSPCHAMLIEGLLIGAGDLVNGVTITQPAAAEEVHYLHIELDEHDVILAEGAPSETFLPGAGARAKFHNAAEFAALYPAAPFDPLARFCAPRAIEGQAFEAAVQRVRARAGLSRPVADLGPLVGAVERIESGRIAGWATSPARPGVPVCLEVLADGIVVAEVLANRPHGRFEVTVAGLSPAAVLTVRRGLDRAVLPLAA